MLKNMGLRSLVQLSRGHRKTLLPLLAPAQGSARMFLLRFIQVVADACSRCRTDPLVHHGRHFGRTIQAFCQVQLLLKQGLARSILLELGRVKEDDLDRRRVIIKHK